MRKNNRAARAARTQVQFFDVVCQTTTWNLKNLGSNEGVHNGKWLFFCLNMKTVPAVLPSCGPAVHEQHGIFAKHITHCEVLLLSDIFIAAAVEAS